VAAVVAFIEELFRAEGRAQQAAKDKAAADALEAQFHENADRPLSVDDAISQLRARSKKH
jgi:hypothetical protein